MNRSALLFFGVALLFAGCDTGTTGIENNEPEISDVSADIAPPYFTGPGPFEWVQLTAEITDRDGDLLDVTWSATSGVFQNDDVTGREVLWQPGAEGGDHLATVTASDGNAQVERSIAVTTWVSLRGCWAQENIASKDPAYDTLEIRVGSDMRDDEVSMSVTFEASSQETTRSTSTNSTYEYPGLVLSAEGDGSTESPVSAVLEFSVADGSTLGGTLTVARGDVYDVALQRISNQICP